MSKKSSAKALKEKKYFGTDGIRARVGEGMIRPDQVLKLGWALGHILKQKKQAALEDSNDEAAEVRPTVMIGKDTRISGYMFESALESGLIASGVHVLLLGPMPTPAIAYLTQTFHADAGIVISASHNPHHDNGIKFFDHAGQKISDEMEWAIEQAFESPMTIVASADLGRARRIDDAPGRYIEFCKSTYQAPIKLDGLKVVLDCAHGATYHVAPSVFHELGADTTAMCNQPDGMNINQQCGATDLAALQAQVLATQADVGIAFDGDGDRVMMVDHLGQVVDGDELLYILAAYASTPVEGVVGTLMSNLGLENALADKGIAFVRAQVGDRHVMQCLKEQQWVLGAENSGHVLCLDRISTGDGIVSALQVLAVMQTLKQPLHLLKSGMKKYPQILKNVKVNPKQGALKKALADNQALQKAIATAEAEMGAQGRVLVRASGTEPLIRVMVEGQDVALIEPHLEKVKKVVETEFC